MVAPQIVCIEGFEQECNFNGTFTGGAGNLTIWAGGNHGGDSFVTGRTGGKAYRVTAPGASALFGLKTPVGAPTISVTSFYFRLPAYPGGNFALYNIGTAI